jgi:glycosyltransferase involved in cell wall biosynthesis
MSKDATNTNNHHLHLHCTCKTHRIRVGTVPLLYRATLDTLDLLYTKRRDHNSTTVPSLELGSSVTATPFVQFPVSGVFQSDLVCEAVRMHVGIQVRKRRSQQTVHGKATVHDSNRRRRLECGDNRIIMNAHEESTTQVFITTEHPTSHLPSTALSNSHLSMDVGPTHAHCGEEEEDDDEDDEADTNGGVQGSSRQHTSSSSSSSVPQPSKFFHTPVVSVVMTVHNCAKYIEHAVRSLQFQTLSNWELIVVDDCSSDTSATILRMLAQEDDRVRYMRNRHNVGCYASKNIGLTHARGAWLTFHDADDCSMSERLEKQLHFCVTGKIRGIEAPSPLTMSSASGQHHSSSKQTVYDCCYATSLGRKTKVWMWTPITMFIRADVFRDYLGSFDTVRFGADSEMRVRLDTLKLRVGVMDEYLYACPDRWIELGTRATSLTGDLSNDEIRMHYKRSYEHFHAHARSTYDENLRVSAMKYAFPPGEVTARATDAQLRPFPLYGLDGNAEAQERLLPSLSDLHSTVVHARIEA